MKTGALVAPVAPGQYLPCTDLTFIFTLFSHDSHSEKEKRGKRKRHEMHMRQDDAASASLVSQ